MAANASTELHKPEINPTREYQSEVSAAAAHDGLKFWQFMIAGSIAGMAEHMAVFPVDTIKTQMQTLSSCPIKSVTVNQAVRSILKSPTVLAASTAASSPWRSAPAPRTPSISPSTRRARGASPAEIRATRERTTVASDAVLTPMDVVKQRLQLRGSPYGGVWDCARRVMKEEGIRAFFVSYRTTVLMNAPFTAVHFATYEAAKRGLSRESTADEGFVVHATAGAAAGALAAAVTTPLDVIKTQLQCQGVCGCDRFASGSIKDIFRTIVKKDGYRGLMRGWMPRMLFHAPAAAICWTTYEAAKTLFQQLNADNRDR